MIDYSREKDAEKQRAEEDYWNEKSKLPERWELEDELSNEEDEPYDDDNNLFKPGE